MSYKNQNYAVNYLIKEEADKYQKDYQEEATEEPIIESKNTYAVVLDKATYDASLADSNSCLSKYYAKYPREDGIDAEGNPVRDLETEVVGHSWESAITAPTDPAKTSSFPWVCVSFDNFQGQMDVQYDGESKLKEDILSRYSFWILSVPNDLGMTDYRLEWGTGAPGEKTFDPSLLNIIFTPSTE